MNRLDDTALRTHMTGKMNKFATIPSGTLALVSGQPEHLLRCALPELARPSDPQLPVRAPPSTGGRLACSWCALVRGHQAGVAWCWNDHDHVVCHRHRRWIGDGNDQPDSGQPDLTDQPDILRANRRHRRLVRRVGRYRATIAYQQARTVCSRWHRNDDHDDFQRLMLRFHGPHWQVSRSHPTLFAARYPQIVALTALLASRYWQSSAQRQWPEPTEFINQVRRNIAPHYRWNLRRHHSVRDPLTELIAEQRASGEPAFTTRITTATCRGHKPPQRILLDKRREDFELMLLSWLGLIIGSLILAAYAVVWTRANQGRLMRRGHPRSRRPPRWSYLLLFIGTGVALLGAEELQRQSIGWWALLLSIGGALIAQITPIALHNRSVRRAGNGPHP